MKILSWNIRGMGNLWSVRRIQQLLKDYRPHVNCFVETKLNVSKMKKICRDTLMALMSRLVG